MRLLPEPQKVPRDGHFREHDEGDRIPGGLRLIVFDEVAEVAVFLLDPDGELSEVLNLDYGDNLDGDRAAQYFKDCLALLDRRAYTRGIAAERERFEKAETPEEKREILERIRELTELKNKLKK